MRALFRFSGLAPLGFVLLHALAGCGATDRPTRERSGLTAALSIEGPTGCVRGASLEGSVHSQVGRVAFVGLEEAQIHLAISIEPSGEGWRAEIETRTRAGRLVGRRGLDSGEAACEALREPLAFVVALILDTPAVREAAAHAGGAMEVEFGLEGLATVGRTPFVTGGVGLHGELSVPDFVPIRLSVAGYFPGSEEVGLRGFEAWAGDVSLGLCPRVVADVFRFEACGGGRAGFVVARGVGFDSSATIVGATVDLELAARPSLRIDDFVVGLGVGVGVSLLRPELLGMTAGGELDVIYVPSLVWGQLDVSLGFVVD